MKHMFIAVGVVAIVAVSGCGSDGKSSVRSTTAAPETTVAPESTVVTTGATAAVLALPGRLPQVDATSEVSAAFAAPLDAASPTELTPKVIDGLQTSFAATGFSADVRLVSIVPSPSAVAEEVTLVFEVRNREESGDDTSPGYDLAVVMKRDQSGSWALAGATRQTICSRGVSGDAALCV